MKEDFILVKEIVNGLTGEFVETAVIVDNLLKASFYPEKNESILWMVNNSRIVIKGDIMQFFTAVERG